MFDLLFKFRFLGFGLGVLTVNSGLVALNSDLCDLCMVRLRISRVTIWTHSKFPENQQI